MTYHGDSRFCWSSSEQALILGAFFYGYIVPQIPGGALSERYGSKLVLGIAIFVASALSLVTPVAAEYSSNALVAVRIFQGLASGVIFPSLPPIVKRYGLKSDGA